MKIKLYCNIIIWFVLFLFIFDCYSFARESSRSSSGRSSSGRSSGGRRGSGGSMPEEKLPESSLKVGDQAILFKSVDENMAPVDMADMTDGRLLVLLTGSCSEPTSFKNLPEMEKIYQSYKEKVNFVWVYSKEYHPEGSSSEVNVWNQFEEYGDHPYSGTTSMEERVQRAKWMKTDPETDLGIPMIIDYVNSEMGKDDAMVTAYGGGSAYSGFIIDCDGKILEAHTWAWADKDEGWPVSVIPFDVLKSTLDKYLKKPPSCYKK